jgi:aspartate aminotransferase, cytoplasmic
MVERHLCPIFDSAYLGFKGLFNNDAWPIRYFLQDLDIELAVCLSMAKNIGLYGDRVGIVKFALSSPSAARVAEPVLQNVQRATITAPPAYGARVAAKVLEEPSIRQRRWKEDLKILSSRVTATRKSVYVELIRLQTPGDWSCIVNQTRMFTYIGLSKPQIKYLEGNIFFLLTDGAIRS